MVRFFTHLVLVLRMLSLPVPDGAANAIIQAYLQILEQEGNDGLVAMYAACLREGNGEDSYARFLRAMDPSASKEARAEALARARQHNLNVATIASETVRLILEEAFATIPALSTSQPDVTSFTTGLSDRDVYLIRSIEWLTMMPETMEEALVKSNAIARYFLALGQAGAAQALLKTLPAGISRARGAHDDDDDDDDALEHEQYQQLFGVFACHELVDEVLARAPKTTATKLEQHNWRKSLHTAIERTHRTTLDLLTSDWLRFDLVPIYQQQERSAELARIRQIFIPDLVLRLHSLLFTHRSLFPVLLQQALDLSKIVAAEDNHVYEEFLERDGEPYRLIAYLDKIREAGLAAVQSGSGSAFAVAVGL
jgi:nuclear pore complex protein Nup107